jgi:hypothetical protein
VKAQQFSKILHVQLSFVLLLLVFDLSFQL